MGTLCVSVILESRKVSRCVVGIMRSMHDVKIRIQESAQFRVRMWGPFVHRPLPSIHPPEHDYLHENEIWMCKCSTVNHGLVYWHMSGNYQFFSHVLSFGNAVLESIIHAHLCCGLYINDGKVYCLEFWFWLLQICWSALLFCIFVFRMHPLVDCHEASIQLVALTANMAIQTKYRITYSLPRPRLSNLDNTRFCIQHLLLDVLDVFSLASNINKKPMVHVPKGSARPSAGPRCSSSLTVCTSPLSNPMGAGTLQDWVPTLRFVHPASR